MNVIDRLEQEWRWLARSTAARRRIQAWAATDPRWEDVADPAGLLAVTERRAAPERSDALLAALAERAGTDPLAARLLLHALLPGLKTLVRRYRVGDWDERVAFVVAAAYERIRTYPVERRPRRVAANVLLDVRQRLLRAHPAGGPEVVPLDAHAHDLPAPDRPLRVGEAVGCLAWGVGAGLLDADTARIIVWSRLGGVPVVELAAGLGEDEQTVRRRRLRAEHRVRAALA